MANILIIGFSLMHTLGIDFDSDTLNFAKLNKRKEIIKLDSFEINGSKNVKRLDIVKANKIIATGFDASDVLIKTTEFNVKKSLFLKKAFAFQNEIATNLDPKKTISIPIHIKKENSLNFFITTKDLLEKHLNRFKHVGIDPDVISSTSIALCRFATYYKPKVKNAFLVHIGKAKTTIIFMKNKMPKKSHVIKIGHSKLLSTLDNKNDRSNLKEAIEKTITSLSKKEKLPILITGNIYDIEMGFEETTLYNSNLEKDFKNIRFFAISIGLSLDSILKDKLSLQFRIGGFTSSKKLQSITKKILGFTFFIFLLSVLFIFFSTSLLEEKEKELIHKFSLLKQYEETNFHTHFNDQNIYSDIDNLEKKLIFQTKAFPYLLKTPKVTEILSWLNSHRELKDMEITDINYELEKYPSVFSKKEKHLARLEVEFKSKSRTQARSFYNSLLKGIGLVDSSKEITWENTQETYKTTFYLKNE